MFPVPSSNRSIGIGTSRDPRQERWRRKRQIERAKYNISGPQVAAHQNKVSPATRNLNKIFLNGSTVPTDITLLVHQAREAGFTDIILDFTDVESAYPNLFAPLSALLGHYRSEGLDIGLEGMSAFLLKCRIDDPVSIVSVDQVAENPLNLVWKFSNATQIHQLKSGLISYLESHVEFSAGVLHAIDWCVQEIFDNVLVHSGTNEMEPTGYASFQVHKDRVVFCIADQGVGISQNFEIGMSDSDAIQQAVKKGVKGVGSIGQGNGLWGLFEVVRSNHGRLTITTGSSSVSFLHEGTSKKVSTREHSFIGRPHKGTYVDFQIEAQRAINLESILGLKEVDLRAESRELEADSRTLVFNIVKEGIPSSSRNGGQRARLLVGNMLRDHVGPVIIDFTGAGIVSSSFSDEFVGKLVKEIGFMTFNSRVKIVTDNSLQFGVIEKAVTQRLAQ